jgi:pimeloyl-ACP methyl ester carboxylesterase
MAITPPAGWHFDETSPTPRAVTSIEVGSRGTVVFLHDTDGTIPAGLAASLAGFGLTGVAPLTGPSWWTTHPLPTELPDAPSAAARVVAEVDRGVPVGPVGLLGIGMGGHGALRIAYQHARRIAAVAAIRPAIDCHTLIDTPAVNDPRYEALRLVYGDPERARQDSAILHIHPLNWPRKQWFGSPPGDPWSEGAERLRMKLYSLGVPHECDLESPDLAEVVAWLAAAMGPSNAR